MVYFASHKSLWKPLLAKLIPTIGLSVGVVASMFAFTYVPQLAVLVFVNGPLAVFTTVVLILSESSTIISVLTRNFLLQDALLDVFDGTLVSRDATNIVSEGRQLKSGGDPMARLGKILKTPFSGFSPKAIIRYFMYLPLNFIPGVYSRPRWSVGDSGRQANAVGSSCGNRHLRSAAGAGQRHCRAREGMCPTETCTAKFHIALTVTPLVLPTQALVCVSAV